MATPGAGEQNPYPQNNYSQSDRWQTDHVDDVAELITGEAVALDLRPSSFVLRAAGTIIDFLLYAGSYLLFYVILLSLASSGGLDDALIAAISVTVLVLFILIAPMTIETLSHGKSLGRLAVGVRIVRDDGGAIGLRHAFIRSLLGLLEIFGTLGGLAALIGLFNSKAKRLGDLVAGTYSQNERVANYSPAIFGVPLELAAWARTADVAKLPDPLARRVTSFLTQAGAFTAVTRERMSRSLANEVAVYVSPVPQASAELFLAAVSAVRRDREFAALQLERARLERLAPTLTGTRRGFPERG